MDIVSLIFLVVSICCLGVSGCFFVFSTGFLHTKRYKLAKQTINELEKLAVDDRKKIKSLEVRLRNATKGPVLEGDLSDLGGLAGQILPQLADFLGPKWAPLLNSPQLQAVIPQILESNPQILQQLLSKITKQPGPDQQNAITQERSI